jgi:hypothetical protein
MTAQAAEVGTVPDYRANRLYQAGYLALTALAFALPFEATQRPLLLTSFATFTNLTVLVWAVAALAAITLAPPFVALLREVAAGRRDPANYVYRRRLGIVLLIALLVSCVLSSLLAQDTGNGLRWTLNILLGGLIWLAVPRWLSENRDLRVRHVCQAIIAGAVIAAAVGICEVVLGGPFARHLLWFKVAPTTIGPFLRLSGTFAYANIAALYFELALPFAVVGLLWALLGSQRPSAAVAGWLLAVDVLFIGLLLTYSRGALLGLVEGAAVAALAPPGRLLVTRAREKRWWVGGVAANLLFVAGLSVLWSPSLVFLRWTTDSDRGWYSASYDGPFPPTIRAAQRITVPVNVSNQGRLTWSPGGAHPYYLSYHWLYPSGQVAVFTGLRSSLPADVPPGHIQTDFARVQAPAGAGRYLLVWDMVQQGITWLSLKSGRYQTQSVSVVGSALGGGHSLTGSSTSGPATLAVPPDAPGREKLWAAALRMVAAHPFFGVGPDGFRLNYGRYLHPPRKNWNMRILANSLPLEIFADLGLVGAALFFALFAVMVGTLTRNLWKGRVVVWWQVALIGSIAAFLGHGLVDYMLFSNAILFLFWLLCGLATTAGESQPVRWYPAAGRLR